MGFDRTIGWAFDGTMTGWTTAVRGDRIQNKSRPHRQYAFCSVWEKSARGEHEPRAGGLSSEHPRPAQARQRQLNPGRLWRAVAANGSWRPVSSCQGQSDADRPPQSMPPKPGLSRCRRPCRRARVHLVHLKSRLYPAHTMYIPSIGISIPSRQLPRQYRDSRCTRCTETVNVLI